MIKYTMGYSGNKKLVRRPEGEPFKGAKEWRIMLNEFLGIGDDGPILLPYMLGVRNRKYHPPEKWLVVTYDKEGGWQSGELLEGSEIPEEHHEAKPYQVYFVETAEIKLEDVDAENVSPALLEQLLRNAQGFVYPANIGLLIYTDRKSLGSVMTKIRADRNLDQSFLPLAKFLYSSGVVPITSAPEFRLTCDSCPKFKNVPFWNYESMLALLAMVMHGVNVSSSLEDRPMQITNIGELYNFARVHGIPFNIRTFKHFIGLLSVSISAASELKTRYATLIRNSTGESKQFSTYGVIGGMLNQLALLDLEAYLLKFESGSTGVNKYPNLFPWILYSDLDNSKINIYGIKDPDNPFNVPFRIGLKELEKQDYINAYIKFLRDILKHTLKQVISRIHLNVSCDGFTYQPFYTEKAIFLGEASERTIIYLITAIQAGLGGYQYFIETAMRDIKTVKQVLETLESDRSWLSETLKEHLYKELKVTKISWRQETPRGLGSNWLANPNELGNTVNRYGGYVNLKGARIKLKSRTGKAYE